MSPTEGGSGGKHPGATSPLETRQQVAIEHRTQIEGTDLPAHQHEIEGESRDAPICPQHDVGDHRLVIDVADRDESRGAGWCRQIDFETGNQQSRPRGGRRE